MYVCVIKCIYLYNIEKPKQRMSEHSKVTINKDKNIYVAHFSKCYTVNAELQMYAWRLKRTVRFCITLLLRNEENIFIIT